MLAPRATELNSAEASSSNYSRDILRQMTGAGRYAIPFSVDVSCRAVQYPMLGAATVLEALAARASGQVTADSKEAVMVGDRLLPDWVGGYSAPFWRRTRCVSRSSTPNDSPNAVLRLATSSSCNETDPAARFSARWRGLLVPGISSTLSAMANSQARAICAGVASWRAAIPMTTGSVRIASRAFLGHPSGENGTNAMPRAVHSFSTESGYRCARW